MALCDYGCSQSDDCDGLCDKQAAKNHLETEYSDKCNDVLELCVALRAVYAIAGEDNQVKKIVEDAINEHGV